MSTADEIRTARRVPAEQVRWMCRPEDLPFATTAELPSGDNIVGQERAVRALDFGLIVPQLGYNLFGSGPPGTGRTTSAQSKATQVAATQPVPSDWIYVHNFPQPAHAPETPLP